MDGAFVELDPEELEKTISAAAKTIQGKCIKVFKNGDPKIIAVAEEVKAWIEEFQP